VIRYLTGCSNANVVAVAAELDIGLLVQPGNRYDKQVSKYPTWAGDNGAFTKLARGFSPEKFRAMLNRPELRANVSTCEFIAAPDKLIVNSAGFATGDALGTLLQYQEWAEEIRAAGFPVALVAQDGLEHILYKVPWDSVDVLFLGGSTAWKVGIGARKCVDVAVIKKKRTHMGRVNSLERLALAQSWGIDTADGTYLAFGPDTNLPNLIKWLRSTRQMSKQLSLGL
jgi:hypothetical protein